MLRGDVLEADYFDGVIFVGGRVYGKLHNPEGAITEFLLLKDVELLDVFEVSFGDDFHIKDRSLKLLNAFYLFSSDQFV